MEKFLPLIFGTWSFIGIWVLGFGISSVEAIYDPLAVPNNRYGVHILETSEIDNAAKLVNSTGGGWGYVTIPLRADDRDRDKWLAFFQNAARLHIIPIIRLATYFENNHWASPTIFDLVDHANFLSDMPWPTQNRYIVLFNEPNHAKEWGSQVNPTQYAALLVDAKEIFKGRSSDFFLISASLDMSAPTNHTSLDALEFYRRMTLSQPSWAKSIDGLSFHSYPNPNFSAPVYSKSRYGITSYRYELKLLPQDLPIFITETGTITSQTFYPIAFNQIWTEPQIVAITPFLLFAGSGEFAPFSLLSPSFLPTTHYNHIFSQPKSAGSPLLAQQIAIQQTTTSFHTQPQSTTQPNILERIKNFFAPSTPTLTVGSHKLFVEIADTPAARSQGLSDRDSLPPNTGLLFIFDKPDRHSFWMKDMRFALDFIWIKSDRVVQITSNVLPPASTPLQIYQPDQDINWVLEVPSGFVKENNIKVGDSVVLNYTGVR